MTLLEMANVKHEAILVNMMKGEHKKNPDLLKINPKGKLPFLMINGKIYDESAANMRLLCQILPTLVKTGYYP